MSDLASRLRKWLSDNAPDCGDNSCLFGGRGKGGMRTNGGCRCFKDVRPDMRRIYIERMQEFIEAAALEGVRVPDGYVLVPREPTREMVEHGCWAVSDIYAKEGGWCGSKAAEDQVFATYRAMLAAAPKGSE